ncbi:MAG: hypothetical protein R3C68_18445 [Myxococcota bacterium]
MALDERVKETWQNVQTRHNVPVNAIGVPIRKNDQTALKIWQEEGIAEFMRK